MVQTPPSDPLRSRASTVTVSWLLGGELRGGSVPFAPRAGCLLPLGDALRRVQRLQRKALLHGELLRPLADQQDVRRLLHDAPGHGGGVADVLQAGHAAAGQRLAVHDAGVELHRADGVAQAAEADRVDLRIVLDGLRPARAASRAGLPACSSGAAVFTAVCPNGQVAMTTKSGMIEMLHLSKANGSRQAQERLDARDHRYADREMLPR